MAKISCGGSMSFNETMSMEIENGEQMIGYQYLHGTNADVGGFNISGTIVKNANGDATISLTYTWNDIIDPNFIYDTDSAKAKFAQSIPFADPTDYIIRISWVDVSTTEHQVGKPETGNTLITRIIIMYHHHLCQRLRLRLLLCLGQLHHQQRLRDSINNSPLYNVQAAGSFLTVKLNPIRRRRRCSS